MLRLVVELTTPEAAANEWRTNLSSGGAYVRGASGSHDEPCTLVLRDASGRELELAGRIVFASADGVGVELTSFADHRARVEAWIGEIASAAEPEPEPPIDLDEPPEPDPELDAELARDPVARNVFERLRGLSVAAQLKVARDSDSPSERMALERLYGKTVWEAILRNVRVSHPEVARIARMGSLPRPLLELIVGNTAWLRSPEVRRALLCNKRLQPDMIPRVLRLLAKPELRLVPNQTAYPSAVREAARRMLKEAGSS